MESVFICECCGRTAPLADDDASKREAKDHYGELPNEDFAVICDECYNKFMAWRMGEMQ